MATVTDWYRLNKHLVATDANGVTVFAIPIAEGISHSDQVIEYCELTQHEYSGDMR